MSEGPRCGEKSLPAADQPAHGPDFQFDIIIATLEL